MQRTVIGGFLFLGGLIMSMGIILSATIYIPQVTSWYGESQLWFSIFGEESFDGEPVQSLFLGFPFVVGIILAVVGLAILGYEYYNSFAK